MADEIEEQGDILRYLAAQVLTIMTSSATLSVRLLLGDLTSRLQ